MFAGVLDDSILKRAREAGILSVALHNIRDYAAGRHRITDDTPYGGGGGMVMKPEPIFRAVETVLSHEPGWLFVAPPPEEQPSAPAAPESAASEPTALAPLLPLDVPIILLSPQGRPFTQAVAEELAGHARLALICGRYEGVDERVRTGLVTDEISIGDFVISGGELAAAIIVDAVTRLQPGALGCADGCVRGFLRHRAAGVSPVHAARRLPGRGDPGDSHLGRPCQGSALASRAGAAPDVGAPP